MPQNPDVLVIGAGPTGLTLGCDLARRGIAVRVVDQLAEPFHGSRGKGLQPRTLEVFDDLGIIDEVLAAGREYPAMSLHAGWLAVPWRFVAHNPRTPAVPYPNVWMLPQSRTEAILRARFHALGGQLHPGTELEGFEQDARGVTATLRRGNTTERVHTRYLVGADGGHSRVRKLLGVPFTNTPIEPVSAVVGDVRVDTLAHRAWHVWPLAKPGPIALCPLPGGELFQLFAQVPSTTTVELTPSGVNALLAAAIGARAPRIDRAPWLSLYRANVRLADRYRSGRIFLAGDAAHVHPPTGAQGLNLGVQDAYNLGWKLGAVLAGAPDLLLDTYEEERRPVAARALGLSTRLLRHKWRGRGDATKQLRTSYRGSSLAGRAPAGDRVPDATWVDARGTPQRLFDVLRGPQVTVVAFGPAQGLASRSGVAIVEGDESLRRALGCTREDFVLIRPDGYLGAIGSEGAIAEYLDRFLPSAVECRRTA